MDQIIALGKKVFHSPTIREELHKQCVKYKITPKVLLRVVATRWNTVAEALERALEIELAIDKLVMLDQCNTSRGAKLKKYKLSTEEWRVLKELQPILKVHHFFPINCITLINVCSDSLLPQNASQNLLYL